MLGRVKIGDKLRVRVYDGRVTFVDQHVQGAIHATRTDAATGVNIHTVRVAAERDDCTVPAQRWPTRDIDLRVGQMSGDPGGLPAEVIGVRLVRRA